MNGVTVEHDSLVLVLRDSGESLVLEHFSSRVMHRLPFIFMTVRFGAMPNWVCVQATV